MKDPRSQSPKFGLVLTGGGARAAYQAGVLRGLVAVLRPLRRGSKTCPFSIIAGDSAGAINGCALATGADRFDIATRVLWESWETISMSDVFRTDAGSLARIGSRWIRDLSFGGALDKSEVVNLLDTQPLREFLAKRLDFDRIRAHIKSGVLGGLSVSATNYATGSAVSFLESAVPIEPWARSNRLGYNESLTIEHVMASASIPILFPPIRLGHTIYGDGSLRLKSPLSPAIHMGADRVIAVGVRHYREPEKTIELNKTQRMTDISLADIAGVILNSVFLDSIDADLERMTRINDTVRLLSSEQRERSAHKLREIPVMSIRPSQDLGEMAREELSHFSKMVRYLLRGIGATEDHGSDLLSYLAFESTYTTRLLKLGFEDAVRARDEVLAFLA